MALLVADCPRCGAEQMTFDAHKEIQTATAYGWQRIYEVFSVCRGCHLSTTFLVSQKDIKLKQALDANGLLNFKSLNDCVRVERYICIQDINAQKAPDHVPNNIKGAFGEGSTCVSVQCWNAAGTMFRLCVDLATRSLLPPEADPGPNKRTRRDLGLRLPWLFDNGKLPEDLRDLSACIREDGNDGAHAGLLGKEDAEDLCEFTVALLERLYTQPERLKLAEARRVERRKPRPAA
jgi:hypothetical protein